MMANKHTARFAALCLALFGALSVATAAEEPETPKAIFDRGMLHYNLGEFDTALGYFSKAYELEPLPDLLFNIAQCHRNLEQYERAVFFFERYLAEVSSEQERARINDLLDELRPLVPDKSSSAAPPARSEPAAQTEPSPAIVSPPAPTPIVQKWWFWAAIAGAVAIGATALAVSLSGSPSVDPPDGAIVFDFRGL